MRNFLKFPFKVVQSIPFYKNKEINPSLNPQILNNLGELKEEINYVLVNGPGILIIKNLIDKNLVNYSNLVIDNITNKQKPTKNDHFSNNLRIWNFYEKFSIQSPTTFIHYHKNPILNLVVDSYLGPKYQISSQINIVKPGSKSQVFHRDYHLGLMELDEIKKYPPNIQTSSMNLTLQGLIAHSDINKINGSTKFVPFSQNNKKGYLEIKNKKIIKECEQNYLQLNLEKGDAVFFNPAIYHAAGENNDNKDRIANIFQFNSAFSKPMEKVNNNLIKKSVNNHILNSSLDYYELHNIYSFVYDNYNYPKNLDN